MAWRDYLPRFLGHQKDRKPCACCDESCCGAVVCNRLEINAFPALKCSCDDTYWSRQTRVKASLQTV